MANTKKYVSLDKLGLYDEKIKKVITDGDAAALASAKSYADGLAVNYDAAGAAATAEANAKAHADSKDAAIQAAQKAADDAAAAAGVADGKAVAAQGEVDALEAYVGTFTASEGVDTVVKYIDAKTANIASDETVGAIADRVGVVEGKVATIEGDYLKGADKTELEGKITEVNTAVATEKSRAEGIEAGLRTDVDAIKGDYLKAADKTELQGNIDKVAGRVATIEGDYLKAADKTELQGKIDAKVAQTDYDAKMEEIGGDIDGLQTQINTIMNNPDTEGVINSINEFTQYIADHGEIADGFRADIDANAKAISDHETLAAQTYETKEDATTKYDELAALVGEKAVQADWNQNDEAAADYIKNRPFYEVSGNGIVLFDETIAAEDLEYSSEFNKYHTSYKYNLVEGVETGYEQGNTYTVIYDGVTYTDVPCGNDYYNFIGDKNLVNYPFCSYIGGTDGNGGRINFNSTTPGPHTIKIIDGESGTLVQLDEKFIPDTIARVTDVNAANTALKNELTTEIGKKADTTTVEALDAAYKAADTALSGRLDVVEAQLGDGEGSVADMVADAKQEAIDAAAADATSKANTAESNAKGHADSLNTAMNTRVEALEAIDHDHANKAELDLIATGDKAKWDAAAAIAHEHGNKTVLDGITAENITTWNTVTSKAAQADLTAVGDRVTALETWHNNFTEVSEEEINALFA